MDAALKNILEYIDTFMYMSGWTFRISNQLAYISLSLVILDQVL
jgi:predicted SPOUT superfamily RNA methylase MTH1